MNDLPRFLRHPAPPKPQYQPDLGADTRELIQLWSKTGVVKRYKPVRRWTWADFLGVLSAVAAFFFCLGYWMAS